MLYFDTLLQISIGTFWVSATISAADILSFLAVIETLPREYWPLKDSVKVMTFETLDQSE